MGDKSRKTDSNSRFCVGNKGSNQKILAKNDQRLLHL